MKTFRQGVARTLELRLLFFPERGCTSKSIPPQVTPDQFSEPAGISIHLNMGIKEIVDHKGLAWARRAPRDGPWLKRKSLISYIREGGVEKTSKALCGASYGLGESNFDTLLIVITNLVARRLSSPTMGRSRRAMQPVH